MKRHTIALLTLLAFGGLPAKADTALLTAEDGWTRITTLPTAADIANSYYVFVDDSQDLMLGIGKGIHQDTKWYSLGVYYRTSVDPTSKDINPMVWTLETCGNGYAMRNLDHPVSPFQTEWDAPWKFDTNDVYTPANDWCEVRLAYNNSIWTIQNGKYPDAGYLGPWDARNFTNGAECAANKTGSDVGHFQIYAISRAQFKQNLLRSASETNPVDITPWYVNNATLDQNATGWESSYAANANGWWGSHAFSNTGAETYQQIADVHQTLTLPKGKYKIAVQGASNKVSENQAFVYGIHNGNKVKAYFTESTQTTTDNNKWNDMQYTLLQMIQDRSFGQVLTSEIEVTTGTLVIGYGNDSGHSWDVFDNFKLYCTGLDEAQLVEENHAGMLEALERFENDYNLKDGTDYSSVTMSADAWSRLIEKVNAVSLALDDVSQAGNYIALKDALIEQMNATDASLRLFKSYKAMVDGATALDIVGSYGDDVYTDTDASEQDAINALNTAFVNYAIAQDATINMADFLGDNLNFIAAEGEALNTDNSNNIHAVTGWEVDYADADTWAVIQTNQSDNKNKLYMRKNWGSAATTLTATKHKMLPVGKYTLSFSWNSNMQNMTNRSHYKLGDNTVVIGEATTEAKTLTYEFEITGEAQPFDLTFGFQKTGTDNTPAQIIVDDITLTYTQPTVTLADAVDNMAAISSNDGYFCNVILSGRTLYKDGSWNTLCLPFSMTADQVTTQLAPTALMELDTEEYYEYEHATGIYNNTLYLNFKKATTITAGKPYIIKWDDAEGTEWVNPTFRGVTVTNGSATGISSTDGTITLQGTYAPVGLPKDDNTNLYLGDDDTLCWPNVDDFHVNAFRAYFKLNEAATARQFVLNFGHDATGISEIENSQSSNSKSSNSKWFDLQGRSLGSQPTKAGLYINNGKKVIVNPN